MTPGSDHPSDDPVPERFADDLIGLDPHDPEARAFAAHLDRMERPNSKATVEGMLAGVDEFAQGINRRDGHRRVVAVVVVVLILLGVVVTAARAIGFVSETFLG